MSRFLFAFNNNIKKVITPNTFSQNHSSHIDCRQAHLWVACASREQSNPQGRSLLKRCQESEPALISAIFSFLLCLSEVKYHWSKSVNGKKAVNVLFEEELLDHYLNCQSCYFQWKLVGLLFSAVSRVEMKNLQRLEQAHFLWWLHWSISGSGWHRMCLCSNLSLLAVYSSQWLINKHIR